MKRSLMVFTAIASFVLPAAAPLAVLAQDQQAEAATSPPPARAQRRAERSDQAVSPQQRQDGPRASDSRPDRPQWSGGQARPDNQPRPDRPSRPDRPNDQGGWSGGQGRPDRPDNGNRPDRPGGQWQGRPDQPGTPDRPSQPDRPGRPDQPTRPNRPDGGQWQGRPDQPNRPDRPDWNRPDRPGSQQPNRPNRPDWNRPDRPGAQQPGRPNRPNWNNNRDYRDFHNRWNQDQWRRDWNQRHRSDWWRNDSRFRGWNGVRLGFYFAPGYGYYSVPRTYWNRQYYVGQYLPDVFWRYQVNDWRTYGLGYPPPGTRWVYVDNTIYLIDDYDGYIIDVVRDAWNW